MNNKIRLYVIDAVALLAFIVIALAIPFDRSACFWLAFIFGIIAILVQIPVMPLAFEGESAKSKFYGFPVARVAVLYLIAQIVLSLIFMALSKWIPAFIPAVLGVLLLCAAVIGFVTTDAIREEVEKQDVKVEEDVTTMRNLQSMAASLVENCETKEMKQLVEKLAEELKYSDPVSGTATKELEAQLFDFVASIKDAVAENDLDKVSSLCKRANMVLAERNNICRTNKK